MERISELDGIRGIAAVVILAFHLKPGGAFFMGWAAVDIFFVLSGYLITSILLRNLGTRGSLTAFYLRRGLRIWPPYYLALAVLVLVDLTIGEHLPLGYLPSFLTFTQGLPWLAGGEFPSYFGHSWTLAMEEQFYLIWPALVVIFGRRYVIPLALMLAVMSLAVRSTGFPPILLVSRCDGFAIGAILASLLSNPEISRTVLRRGFSISSILFAVYLCGRELGPLWGLRALPGSTLLGLNLLFGSLIGMIVLATGSKWLSWLRSKPLVHLGQTSYGLYLYHALVYYLVFKAADSAHFGPSFGRDLTAFGMTWLVANLSWRYFERPLLALKDRIPYGSTAVEPRRKVVVHPDYARS